MSASYYEPAPIYDNIDFDMVIKVLSQTAFSSSPYYNLFLLVEIDQFRDLSRSILHVFYTNILRVSRL